MKVLVILYRIVEIGEQLDKNNRSVIRKMTVI